MSLGGHCKPSPVAFRGKALENVGYFAFWIAQKIAIVALRQQTVTKAYTRNQWGSEFGIPNWYTGLKIALDMAREWIPIKKSS